MIKTKLGFLFLGGLSVAMVLSVGLFEVKTAQAGPGDWFREQGKKVDPTNENSVPRRILRENDPTNRPAFAENQWGNAGGVGYPAAAKSMRANNGQSQGLDGYQKKYLRPHFESLVDQVAIIYNANLLNELSASGYKIPLEQYGGQTFCNRIYLNDPYKPNDRDQLILLAHELTHSKQCQQLGGEGKFGYHYFKEFKKAGQIYENNKLEKEAYAFQGQFKSQLPLEDQLVFVGIVRHNAGSLYKFTASSAKHAGTASWDTCPEGTRLLGHDFQVNGFWMCASSDIINKGPFYFGNVVGNRGFYWELSGGKAQAVGNASWDTCREGRLGGRVFNSNGFWFCQP